MRELEDVLTAIDTWGADHAAAAVVTPRGVIAMRGDGEHVFRWASVTKLVTALTVLIATERGVVSLDEDAGPPGATVRHLLAHASGLEFEGSMTLAAPATRRVYSNAGFDAVAAHVAERAGEAFEALMRAWVLGPLGMDATTLRERPSQGLHGPIEDVARLAAELLAPSLVAAETFEAATSVAFPGLVGLLPGVGRFDPLDWGLGFELHDGKAPHWMPATSSPETFGHFGGSGTLLWVDPVARIALVVLTDREYGPWALEAWPRLGDAVLAASADAG
jgi:CubicO group peptidase (beta-lactamase class C family)